MDEAVEALRTHYDTSPYESHAFPQSAPGHLAAIAHLYGLDVPDVSTARVLEIGCSAGGNLIPFAAWHPEARAVGIDLLQVQIDQGRQRVQRCRGRTRRHACGAVDRDEALAGIPTAALPFPLTRVGS